VEKGNSPLEDWHSESKRSMTMLVEALDAAEQIASDARSNQIQAESQRDEELNRSYMFEVVKRRLEDDLRALEERYRLLESTTQDRLRAIRMELENADVAKADAIAMKNRVQEQLDRANAQNRLIHDDLKKMQEELSDVQNRSRERIAQLEEIAAKYGAMTERAEAERDSAIAELQLLKKKLEAQSQELDMLNREMRSHEEEKRGGPLRDAREISEYQKKFALLSENMRKQSTQLAQTKNLLQVNQEQKRHLQEENNQLKGELRELMSKTLHAAARDVGVQLMDGGEEEEEMPSSMRMAGGGGGGEAASSFSRDSAV